jgi:hypothetical protein
MEPPAPTALRASDGVDHAGRATQFALRPVANGHHASDHATTALPTTKRSSASLVGHREVVHLITAGCALPDRVA